MLQEYAASVATRGIIHCNSSRSKHDAVSSGLGWRPLNKPQWYTANKTVSKLNEIFFSEVEPSDLCGAPHFSSDIC